MPRKARPAAAFAALAIKHRSTAEQGLLKRRAAAAVEDRAARLTVEARGPRYSLAFKEVGWELADLARAEAHRETVAKFHAAEMAGAMAGIAEIDAHLAIYAERRALRAQLKAWAAERKALREMPMKTFESVAREREVDDLAWTGDLDLEKLDGRLRHSNERRLLAQKSALQKTHGEHVRDLSGVEMRRKRDARKTGRAQAALARLIEGELDAHDRLTDAAIEKVRFFRRSHCLFRRSWTSHH